MYIAIEFATVIFEMLMLSIYIRGLYQSRIKGTAFSLLAFIITGAGLSVLSILPVDPLIRLIYGFASFMILPILLYKAKWISAFYSALLLCVVNIIVETASMGIIAFFGIPAETLKDYGNNRVVFIVVSTLIQFFCIFLIIKLSNWKKTQDSLVEAIPLLLCQGFSIFICYIMFLATLNSEAQISLSFIAGSIGLLYINIIIFLYIERVKKVSELKKQNELAELQYKSKLEYLNQIKDDQYETRALWHDIKKYLNTMNELINMNDIVHAKECINQVTDLFDGIGNVVDVGNTMVSAVLNAGIQKARRMDIETELDIRVQPDLNISAADLSIIIGNTFDNAIEACGNLTSFYKKITIQLIQKGSILFYEIRNPFERLISTPSENPKLHGFGLKNVKRCVDKYKGSMTAESEDAKYIVSIHMNIPLESANTELVL